MSACLSRARISPKSSDPSADRTFLRDAFGFASVDAGHGWLIFALPPAEVAVHPSEKDDRHELYFTCDDLRAEILALGNKGVRCSEVQEARWGSIPKMHLSGGKRGRSLPTKASIRTGFNPKLAAALSHRPEFRECSARVLSRRVATRPVCPLFSLGLFLPPSTSDEAWPR
jgi:hypothetical protein